MNEKHDQSPSRFAGFLDGYKAANVSLAQPVISGINELRIVLNSLQKDDESELGKDRIENLSRFLVDDVKEQELLRFASALRIYIEDVVISNRKQNLEDNIMRALIHLITIAEKIDSSELTADILKIQEVLEND